MMKNRSYWVVLVVSFALLGGPGAFAEDSLLGLPRPINPDRPGAVLLHGGGYILDSVLDRFIELAGGRSARIVFVPSAGYRRVDYPSAKDFQTALETRYGGWMRRKARGELGELMFLTTDNSDDANDPKFVRFIENATGVWFSGGRQSRLNYRYVGEFPGRTRFQDALLNLLHRGGVIGGTSAGTAAMPEIMTLYAETDEESDTDRIVAAHGFGLFHRAIVEQHFKGRSGRLERFITLLKDRDKINSLAKEPNVAETMTGIAVDDRAALVIRNNSLEALGEDKTHLFLKSDKGRTIHWHELEAGETAKLVPNPDKTIQLIRQESPRR